MKTRIAALAIAAVLLFVAGSTSSTNRDVAADIGPPTQTSHILIHDTLQPGQAIVSWTTVADVSKYRIAYVNMDTFHALRRATPAADWRQAVSFAEIESTDADTSGQRTAQTINHLVPGAPYAFTVMTANEVTRDSQTTYSSFRWPRQPVWTHHQVQAPLATAPPQPTPANPATTPTPVPTPALTDQEPTEQQYEEAVQYMLELINEARYESGAPPVVLGTNPSAQQHANDMQAQCFQSHWGSDGLKPYMRYTLAGGHQASSENTSSSGNCFRLSAMLFDPTHTVDLHMYGLLSSPGHRAAILDPDHATVNIGIKVGPKTEQVVQVFEHDDVTFTAPPHITGTTLAAAGETDLPTRAGQNIQLRIRLTHDRPPHALTNRQLASTSSYGEGTPVAVIEIPSDTTFLPDQPTAFRLPIPHMLLPDPYDAPAQPPLTSHAETSELRQAAATASANPTASHTTGFIIEPARRDVVLSGTRFSFEVDIAAVLDEFGPGVYTVIIYASSSAAPSQKDISAYSIFHQVEAPATSAD